MRQSQVFSMPVFFRSATRGRSAAAKGSVAIVYRHEIATHPRWEAAFAAHRKDRRYYEIVEDTLRQDFDYGYFAIKDEQGEVRAIQPFFILDQDLLAGTGRGIRAVADAIRRLWPRFLHMRTLMVGCAAGEGHLDGDGEAHRITATTLAAHIRSIARKLKTPVIVLKEFPAHYRSSLQCFRDNGFARVPSMPMTRLNIEYKSFEDYLNRVISPRTRGKLRRKLRQAARAEPAVQMSVVQDVSPIVDEIYPLYLQVYERSSLRFEKLTKEYLSALGRQMPDKVRFFLWRQSEKVIAFAVYLVQDAGIHSEYIGFDYRVAFDLNLYYLVFRDTMEWGIANGYKWFGSTGLNYDPKFHLRQSLDPVDLYVRHTSGLINAALRRVLPLIEPTRYDKTLRQFPNYKDLWG